MNLFLVESPTQVLNAIEAKHRFEIDDCYLVILLTGLFDRTIYELVIDRSNESSNWKKIVYLRFYFVARQYDFGKNRPKNIIEKAIEIGTVLDLFRKRARIDRLARRISPVKKLFLGQYRLDTHLYFRHFANVCQHEELFVLDDGTDTLLINRQRRDETSGMVNYVQTRSNNLLKRAIKKRFGEWNITGVNALTFFTNLRIEVDMRDRLIHNDYRYLRSLASACKARCSHVFFLGQTLVDDGYINLSNYLIILKKIKDRFLDREFFYISHPRESQRYLNIIAHDLQMQVLRFHVPVEFEMILSGNRPEILAGFFCSALENCATIFHEDLIVQAYRLNSKLLLKNHDEIEDIYFHFQTVKAINVIESPDYP